MGSKGSKWGKQTPREMRLLRTTGASFSCCGPLRWGRRTISCVVDFQRGRHGIAARNAAVLPRKRHSLLRSGPVRLLLRTTGAPFSLPRTRSCLLVAADHRSVIRCCGPGLVRLLPRTTGASFSLLRARSCPVQWLRRPFPLWSILRQERHYSDELTKQRAHFDSGSVVDQRWNFFSIDVCTDPSINRNLTEESTNSHCREEPLEKQ